MSTCTKCGTNVINWIKKFSTQNKVYLDDMYFDENKVPHKVDERGSFITGEKFAEIELAKAIGRCPKCGDKKNAGVIQG